MNKSSRERDNCIARWVKILNSPAATDFDAANIAHRSKVCWHLKQNLLRAVIKKLLHRGDPSSQSRSADEREFRFLAKTSRTGTKQFRIDNPSAEVGNGSAQTRIVGKRNAVYTRALIMFASHHSSYHSVAR